MSREKNPYEEAYGKGVDEAKKAGAMDQFTRGLADFTFPWEDQKLHDSRNKGYEDARAGKHDSSNSHCSSCGSGGGSGK